MEWAGIGSEAVTAPEAAFDASQIERAFTASGLAPLPQDSYGKFAIYLALLLRWNARLNLTAIREPSQMIQRHFVECSFAAQHLPEDIETLMDFGSGAGFPGIPIAICRPGIRVTLAEAHGKKASFLREVIRAIGVPIQVYEGRVESMPGMRDFGAVSMRAVEKMDLAIPIAAERAERYLAVLTTDSLAGSYGTLTPEFQWLPSVALPHGEHAVLAVGKRR